MSESDRTVLITGCSSGIGHETARRLAGAGWTVYASARRPDSIADLAEAGCKTLALDVTDEGSMAAAVMMISVGRSSSFASSVAARASSPPAARRSGFGHRRVPAWAQRGAGSCDHPTR